MTNTNEVSVLGSVFLDNSKFEIIKNQLDPLDFLDLDLRQIYMAMIQVDHKALKIDYSTIMSELPDNMIDRVMELSMSVPSTANLNNYIMIVKEDSNKRKLLRVCEEVKDNDNFDDMKDKIENTLSNMQVVSNEMFEDLGENNEVYIDELEKRQLGQGDKLLTLFPQLDQTIAIRGGNLCIIAARPKDGKSAFVMNMIRNFAKQDKKGLWFTWEMMVSELKNRLVAHLSPEIRNDIKGACLISARDMNSLDKFSKEQWITINEAKNRFEELGVTATDTSSLYVEDVVNAIIKWKQNNKLDYVIIDYLQMMYSKKYIKGGSRNDEIKHIVSKLKETGQRLNIPVIALAQFNRNSEKDNRKPKPSDLRGSGAIEEYANWMLTLHSGISTEQKYEDSKSNGGFYITKVYVDLNRSGEMGKMINYRYYGDQIRFVEQNFKGYDSNNNQVYENTKERKLEDL